MYFYTGAMLCYPLCYTFAAVRADENYELITAAFKELIKEVNELVRVKQIMVGEVKVTLDLRRLSW